MYQTMIGSQAVPDPAVGCKGKRSWTFNCL